MNYTVILAPEALEDLQNIYDYIAYEKESVINAESQLSRLQEKILKLDLMPESFRLYPKDPWKSKGLRFFPVDNYLIFYTTDNENHKVNVLRVIYGKMDLDSIWR